MKILGRGLVGLAATLALITGGVVGFATAASAAPVVTVTPSGGLQPTGSTVVTVSGSGFAASSIGALLECNTDPGQPTISVVGHDAPVSCGPAPGTTTIVSTDATGSFPATSFTVTTGTVGPPATGTDSSGGNAVSDAANYPCPPTKAQQAAGDTCVIAFGDTTGNRGTAPLSFAGACAAPASAFGYDAVASDGVFSTSGISPIAARPRA